MSIISDLFHQGYSIRKLSCSDAFQIAVMKLEALKIFHSPKHIKDSETYESQHLGYRPVGGEYVGTPEFWDVNESLSFSFMAASLIKDKSPGKGFYQAAKTVFPIYDRIVQETLYELKEYYGSAEEIPETINASWIQLNYYEQALANKAKRELMQGKHEDGHLITLWSAQDAGLEFFPEGKEGKPSPLILEHDEILIMPGELLTKLTGGDIKPLFHQVRRIDDVYTRLAAMYFPNPDPQKSFFPFASHAEKIDLGALTKNDKLLIRPGNPTLI